MDRVGDPFWIEHPPILVKPLLLVEFFPTFDMTLAEKLNAITRLIIYCSLVTFALHRSPTVIYWGILFICIVVFIYEVYPNKYERLADPNINIADDLLATPECTHPTKQNPFMNYLLGDNPGRLPACRGPGIDRVALNLFNNDLFQDIDSIYSRNTDVMDRMFVTQPSTSVDDRNVFMNWLFYKKDKICKEDPYQCAPQNTDYDLRFASRYSPDSKKIFPPTLPDRNLPPKRV